MRPHYFDLFRFDAFGVENTRAHRRCTAYVLCGAIDGRPSRLCDAMQVVRARKWKKWGKREGERGRLRSPFDMAYFVRNRRSCLKCKSLCSHKNVSIFHIVGNEPFCVCVFCTARLTQELKCIYI